MRVEQLMTRAVAAVKADAPLKDVAEVLAKRGISGVPVVDDGQHVVGVVSETDIVAKEGGPRRRTAVLELLRNVDRDWLERRLQARTAGEAMTSPAITVRAYSPVADAAMLMIEHGVRRLPVLDRDDRLTGIVTRADIVRAFTRSDAEIAHEIANEVLVQTFWIQPHTVEVDVEQGEVTLSGELDTKETATLLKEYVERVPGVVGVRSRLRWRAENGKESRSPAPTTRPRL